VSRPDPPKRSERREAFGPSIKLLEAQDSERRPRGESRGAKSRTHEVRVHVDFSGGRSWSYASRVLATGTSQGVVVEEQGASRKEARSIADAGHEPREGESVRGRA